MSGLFIKKVTIKNFRCFENQDVTLSVPDVTHEGSGLNILIGENANGKTTVLEAINFLTQSSYSTENRLNISDFFDKDKDIVVRAEMNEFRCRMPYPGNYFESDGIEFRAKCRDQKSRGKLLSAPFHVNSSFLNKYPNYKNSKGADSGKEIQGLFKSFDNGNVIEDELNVFLFDKNRTRQISTGTFRTTFDRICEDLNWKFAKKVDSSVLAKLVENISGEYFNNVMETAQKGTGEKLAHDLSEFFDNENYEDLKIELLDLLHPFSNAFFALREDSELKQIKARELGSGIEMILTLLLLKSIAGESKGAIIYLIDEPELHLHPKAQEKLIELLIAESKSKQIVLSTHSPYIFKNCLNKGIGLKVFKRDSHNKIVVNDANAAGWGKLPWSPSWGEINYHAFGLATVEFHNELYGFLQESKQQFKQTDFDSYLETKGIPRDRVWIKLANGNRQHSENVTLPTYIRNSIHHPENTANPNFTPKDLEESINQMLNLL